MTREDLQRFRTTVEGRTVFILGGGASVTKETIARLNASGEHIFCLNSSFKFIQNPLGVLWCDEAWAATNKDKLDASQAFKFSVKANGTVYITKNIKAQSNATVLNKTGDFGFDPNLDNVKGNNSGCYSINLLTNCKVKRIVLVGFDMKATSNKAHFHNDYTYSIRPSVYKDLFIPSMESMNKQITESGLKTKIYNTNFDSGIRCFEFKTLESFI